MKTRKKRSPSCGHRIWETFFTPHGNENKNMKPVKLLKLFKKDDDNSLDIPYYSNGTPVKNPKHSSSSDFTPNSAEVSENAKSFEGQELEFED